MKLKAALVIRCYEYSYQMNSSKMMEKINK